MAMLNWEGWAATNFQGWGSAASATPAPTPAPVGGGGGKRRLQPVTVTYRGKEHYFVSEAEAEEYIEALRPKVEPVAQPAPKRAKKAPAAPPPVVLHAPPDMSHLRALVDAHNARVAQEHKEAVAAYARERAIEQDDADIFALLQKIGDE